MRRQLVIPPDTIELQAKAADPGNSVWVSANAGSGKTHVLAQRVVRLLLQGTDPSRILCLTYTKAAAANMANRVFKNLAAWSLLDDEKLAEQIREVDGSRPDREKLRRARRLFAKALETPGGLKIQTIHAFCESVLHQFPLEANITAQFEMLDSQMEAALFATARREMLTGVSGVDRSELSEAFAIVLERGGEAGLDALLAEIVQKRDGLRAFIDAAKFDAVPYSLLFEEFGYGPGDSTASIAATVWPLPGFEPGFFARFAVAAEETDAKSVLKNILPHASLAFTEADPLKRLALLKSAFLKADGDPYDSVKAFKKALHDRFPDLADRYSAAAETIIKVSDRVALFRMLEGTRAALTVADWLIARYEQLKSARGYLDFNDLITRTLRLLARQDAGSWVQYKLDKGIDHILLDEAQDTSPDQWSVMKLLAEEFFSGRGARDEINRTVFAVGDEKQSIYSFQGAVPESFAVTGQEFSIRIRAAERRFEAVTLSWSFRSTEDVLSAVDTVFADESIRRGLTRDGGPINHRPIRADAPGYVEVWPSIGADAVEEPEDWTEAIDHARAPAVRLAENIANTVKGWIDSGEIIEGTGKRLSAGDVLVLVRKRDSFVHALSRSLKEHGISVAGADRLSLPGHIAVKDLMALGRFLMQPEDDLSLAAVLKSPIFGLDDDALFAIAAGRPEGRSLQAALRRSPAHETIVAQLDSWANEAAFRPVFEFYSAVLGRDGVRRKMIARLGHEASDILDEFLNFCLAEERTGLPGLEGFLAVLENAGPEIKREMDQGRDEVRIMTVHASKGLEAPVVFLVDCGSAPFSSQHLPRLMAFEPKSEDLRHAKGYLWRAGSDAANGFSRKSESFVAERAAEEYRRLLYVGMTRAEDRLIVCGCHGKRAQNPATWHAIVTRALSGVPLCREYVHPATGESVLRYCIGKQAAAVPQDGADTRVQLEAVPLPAGLFEPLPAPDELPRPLSPSHTAAVIETTTSMPVPGRSPVLDPDEEPGYAVQRGIAVHKLLQMLPEIAAGERRAAALRYLAHAGADWPESVRQATVAAVEAILEAPDHAPLFAAGSRAEVAIAGTLTLGGRDRAITGKIDRLAVTDSEVLLVDYKTSRPPPVTLAEVPEAYVTQLALYRALLQPIYPGRKVSAVLLFTEAPRLIAVPAEAMDEALARLTQA